MLKNLLLISTLGILATSCTTSRSTTAGTSSATHNSTPQAAGDPKFLNNISIKPDAHTDKSGSSISNYSNTGKGSKTAKNGLPAGEIENYPALQFKYAILENASVEEVNNPKLLSFMDYWYGTPYHYGGTTRDGIDCSAFAFLLMSSVYGVAALPRTSKEQYDATRHIDRTELREGDLVFFHTLGRKRAVTHVGIYLRNNKFIHASVSGVMISDMNDGYYDKHFIGAGRIMDASQSALPATQAAGSGL